MCIQKLRRCLVFLSLVALRNADWGGERGIPAFGELMKEEGGIKEENARAKERGLFLKKRKNEKKASSATQRKAPPRRMRAQRSLKAPQKNPPNKTKQKQRDKTKQSQVVRFFPPDEEKKPKTKISRPLDPRLSPPFLFTLFLSLCELSSLSLPSLFATSASFSRGKKRRAQ